ncbi:MAG: hypothetical protein ACSHXY_04705 [Alphaproteobacteria bacterium]
MGKYYKALLIIFSGMLLASCEAGLKKITPVPTVIELSSKAGFWGGRTVTVTIQNTGSEGAVYGYVNQNGQIFCPKKTYMNKNERRTMSFRCDAITGEYSFFVAAELYLPDEVKNLSWESF